MTQTITLQHTVACDFAQIRAAQAPQGTCNRVLFDQRLPSSAMQSDVSEMRGLRQVVSKQHGEA